MFKPFLRSGNPDRRRSLVFILLVNRKRIWLKTGIKLFQHEWDEENEVVLLNKELPKETAKAAQSILQERLNAKREKLTKFLFELEHVHKIKPTAEFIQTRWDKSSEDSNYKKIAALPRLYEYVEYYQKKFAGKKSKGYLRNFKQTRDYFFNYNPKATFEDVNESFVSSYLDYLVSRRLDNITINKDLKRVKTLLKEAKREGYRFDEQALQVRFKSYSKRKFYLTWAEVELIEKFQPLEEHVVYKDFFLFECYTGLRHSDVFNLKMESFITQAKKLFLDFNSIKTRANQNIPLNPKAIGIAKKYGYKLPRLYQHDVNEKIKLIGRAAGVKGTFTVTKFIGIERIDETFERWEMISNHTGRRTFAKHWISQGGDIGLLSRYLGHSSIAQTWEYVGYDVEEMGEEIEKVFK